MNQKIYGDGASDDLIQSIREKGVLSPLLITHDDRIISGHRRWESSIKLELTEVPIVVFGSKDELDIEEALIESNRQREKSSEQVGREYTELARIYNARFSAQGARSDIRNTTSDDISSEVANSKPSKRAAQVLGVSSDFARQAAQVVSAIDDLKEQGEPDKAEALRNTLNHKSVRAAHQQAKSNGYIPDAKPKPQPSIRNFITLAEWIDTSDEHHSKLLSTVSDKTKYNETNDNVEWALWTWNPVTGCLHDCAYCYARDIAQQRYSHLPADERFLPVFYPERLSCPTNTRLPDLANVDDPVRRIGLRNVFTCSMADLFGKWVPAEWIHAVLRQAWDNPQWTFLFLTKFPIRMAEFDFPPNSWIGTTVDKQWAVERAEKAFRKIRAGGYEGVAWLSCEPMLERLTFSSLDMFDWVVMGGSSKSTQTPEFKPPFEWINHLYNQAKAHSLPVYMKTNLGIEQRERDYPA